MSDSTALGLVTIVVITAFFSIGSVEISSWFRDRDCKNGVPVVIDAKVYRCVEAK